MENKEVKKGINFDLLENAFDFILSGLMYIAKPKTKSDLKYAILHLCAGTELVLKERLRIEHWSLLFENVNKANIPNFESGSFTSVCFRTCIDRLKGICNISLLEIDERRLFNLREKRNRLEHLGITDSVEALTGLAARVLSILLGFINTKLSPDNFSETEANLLKELRSKLGEFQRFVEKRLKKIDQPLKQAKKKSYIVQCPACYQESLILEDRSICLFCGYSAKPEIAANEWIEMILGESAYVNFKEGVNYPLYTCPQCERETLVDIGFNSSQFGNDQYICFACSEAWGESDMDYCMICGCPYLIGEDNGGICSSCIEYQMTEH